MISGWGESGKMAGISGHLVWGGASTSAYRIQGPAEVPPEGVSICAMRNPGHRYGLSSGRGCVVVHLPPEPLSGGYISDPWEGNHRYDGQTGWYFPTRPNSDCRGELDGVLHDHGAPRYGAPRDGRIMVGRPRPPDGGGEGGYMTETCGGCGDHPGRGLDHRIESGIPTDGEYSAYRGVDISASLNHQ